ncbi:MAG: LTA synthase family protein [Clostridiales Family XIII bacterium]|nr:LTA synthase family protein [Clostridiales Family XIII bacterium]
MKEHRSRILGHAAFLAGMSVLLTAFIQWRIEMPEFITANTPLFFFSAIPLFFILVIALGVFGNLCLGTCVVSAGLVLLTYADTVKYALRMEHVFPGDIEMFFHLGELSGMYDAKDSIPQWFFAGGLIAIGIVLTILLQKKNRQNPRPVRVRVFTRLSFVIIGFALLLLSTWPIRSPQTGDITPIGYDYIAWNQTMNYEQNGFIAAFVSNLKAFGMEEPEGYSEEAVKAIADKYQKIASADDSLRTSLSDIGVDVVYVMNESFSDPDRFSGQYPWDGPATELVPELHRIFRESAHGWIYSPRYGGGTANIEYEALTGFSTYFTSWAYPYQSMLPSMERFPSVAHLFKAAGYDTIGLHAYGATMYRRNTVYPIMGYDEFHGAEEFNYKTHDRSAYYISDKSSYSEAKSYLDGSAGSKFITLVTMQNHPQYGKQFKEQAFRSTAWDESYSMRKKIQDYMELIHSSDAATGAFVDWVAAREKPTVVVFWGDHLPGVYDQLLKTDATLGYETPYFIYANAGAQELCAGSPEDDLGEVSPNFVSSDLFDYLNVRKPPWYYLLDAVRMDAPIVTAAYFDENGMPQDSEAMTDYAMIAYDMIEGEQYADVLGMFDIAAED